MIQKAPAMRSFATPRSWATWLAKNHTRGEGLWLRLFKKDSGVRSMTYAQALDEALCWGWIDGQARPCDEQSWLTRFTPRRPRSVWSKRNRDIVARLEAEGRMQPPGRAQVDAAKADGRWERAYDSPATARVPDDFLQALRQHPQALAFFETLNRANAFAIASRLQTAKLPATRQRRFDLLLQMMIDGRTLHG